MSKLDEIILELCPNGVEYKTIGDIATDIYRGAGIKREDVTEEGISCVRYGEIYTTYGIWFDSCVSHTKLEKVASPKYFEHGDILFAITGESIEDIAKSTAYVGYEKCLAGGDIVVVKHHQDPKYLSYALATTDARKQKSAGKVKSKVVHSSVPAIQAIKVPIPPIEIQREIVRILDNFTELSAELSTELSAELSARKLQYEYYRDSLLSFGNNVPKAELGSVCNIFAGGDAPKEAMSKEKTAQYTIPIISNGIGDNALYGFTDVPKITTPAVTVAARGTIGYAEYRDYPYFPIIRLLSVIPKDEKQINTKYLYYCLQGKQYSVPTTGIPQLTSPMLKKEVIPIPSRTEQDRIVRILDSFDAICTNICSGLPAEIEARQKQYEYYRDKLLSFKEIGA